MVLNKNNLFHLVGFFDELELSKRRGLSLEKSVCKEPHPDKDKIITYLELGEQIRYDMEICYDFF